MASLRDFWEKINRVEEAVKAHANRLISGKIYILVILILVASASFGLGRLSKFEENRPPVKILENMAVPAGVGAVSSTQFPAPSLQGGKYVASINGAKYHLPWCSGATRIKEENKIWFETKEEAERAGYGPAANCKGL